MPAHPTPFDPEHEYERLTALRSFDILDTPPEEEFDVVAEMASQLLSAPLAFVSLADEGRLWFKAKYGTAAPTAPSRDSFCLNVVTSRKTLIVEDATADPRFASGPLVAGELGVRAYAGCPLVTRDGYVIGTVCVADTTPRSFTAAELHSLRRLTSQTMRILELRRAAVSTREGESFMRRIYLAAQVGDSLEERMRKVLTIGAQWLGMEIGLVGSIEGEHYTIRHLVGDDLECAPGDTFLLSETFCRFVADSREPLAVADVNDAMMIEHPAYPCSSPESFIGARIMVEGEVYGTLNYSSSRSRSPFTDLEADVLQLMAVWAGAEIGRQMVAERQEALVEELNENLARLRSLEGLLPICSWCRCVRDDAGAWQGLEEYVQQHSNAQFSHGICPSCFDAEKYEK